MKILKNIKKNTLIILFITLLVLFLVLKDDFNTTIDALKRMDIYFLLIAVVFFFLSIVLKAYVSYKTVACKEKYSFMESIKHSVITQFFNGVTPFSTGGQPMEIYMLTEHEIRASHATNYTMQNFIFYQIALVIFGLIAVLYNHFFNLFSEAIFLKNLVILGFLINTAVAVGLFVISFSKKTTAFVTENIISFLSRIKVVKDKEKTKERWKGSLKEFHSSAKSLFERKKLFVGGIFINLISLACLYIVPLFVVYSLHDFTSINVMDSLVSSAYVLLIGSFVPIPGASGGIEYGFIRFFGTFLTSSITTAVLLVWRFITYYLPMIIGAIVFNIDERGKKRCE